MATAWYDKINQLTTFFTRRKNKTKVYDTAKKQLNLSRLLEPDDIYRIINDVAGSSSYGSTIFNRFFDLNIGRADRYADYEQMYYRIPEVAEALHILVDLILSPNIGEKNNLLRYHPKDGKLGAKAEEYSRTLIETTTLNDHLSNIVFGALFFGDCFVSNRKTNFGIQYTIHDTKESSILFDKSTGINLGLVVRVPRTIDSPISQILSLAAPSISLDVPRKLVGIICDKRNALMNAKTDSKAIFAAKGRIVKTLGDFDYEQKVKEIEDLINEVLRSTSDGLQTEFKYFPPGKYTQFSIYYNDFYHPYGTSILDPLRAVAKQLLLTEAALSIYRMTRAPLRYKFLVEVGALPEKNIRGMLNQIKDSIKKDRVISDDSSESIDSIPDIVAPEEDFWIPVVGGTPWMDIQPLEGGSIEPFTGDVEYFKNKLIGGLGIPPSYLGQEEGTSTRSLITLEDMRLNRTIKKYQHDINIGLSDLNDNNLILAEVPELIGQVEVRLPPPQTLEDNVRVENMSGRLSVAGDFNGLFPNVPKLWIMKNILCFEKEEIEEMEKSIDEQKKYKIFNDNVPGRVGPDGEPMEGGGGGFGGFGGFGGDVGEFSTAEDQMLDNMQSEGNEKLEDINFDEAMDEVGADVAAGPQEGPAGEGEMAL